MAENDTENQVEPEAEAETPEPEAASEPEAPVAPGDEAPAEEEPEPESEPAEQPPASEPTEVPAAEPPEEEAEAAEEAPVAEAEPEPEPEPAEEAPVAEAEPEPKRKRKRLPRIQRPTRARPRRERPKARKPITRLPKPEHERGRRQERRGVVVSSAMDKTIVVEVDTLKAHPRYKKVVRRSTKFHAHDERNEAKVGDIVRIVETRPLSKTKYWRLAEVVEAAK